MNKMSMNSSISSAMQPRRNVFLNQSSVSSASHTVHSMGHPGLHTVPHKRVASHNHFQARSFYNQSQGRSLNDSDFQGLEPQCIGVDGLSQTSPQYSSPQPPTPHSMQYQQELLFKQKVRATSKLFGYKGLDRRERSQNLFTPSEDYQLSAGVSVFNQLEAGDQSTCTFDHSTSMDSATPVKKAFHS